MTPIIDVHAHVYPEAIAVHAAESIGRFYGGYPMRYDGQLSTLLAGMRRAGIGRALVSSVATTPHQVSSINRFLADAANAHPGHITALGAMHPDSLHPVADFREILALGLCGVKLHPDFLMLPMDDPRFYRIYELCEGRLPICCHLGDSRYDNTNPNRAARVLRDFPDLTLVGAHLGGYTVWDRVERERLYEYKNLYADCSSTLRLLPTTDALRLIRLYGAERVMFGTDYPMWDASPELDALGALGLSEDEQAKILFETAGVVYGVQPGAAWEDGETDA